ncbi:MAG: Rpn family recombination-promoting nuclease/putative transposase [Treponema sp.]|nr:Rpn family recombination-promoting nuclease/putative transposase [Treponema sp.]
MNSNVNTKHKASVFSTLFSDPETLRELYSAIEGVDVPKDAIISINTLSDVLFMGQLNDVSFTINDQLVVLIEHQSTINNNIPIRMLMYIGRVYEKIIERERLYQKKLVKIPAPEFIVLYNGVDQFPDYKELRLSDAFMNIKGQLIDSLELAAHVYNINHGRNPQMLEKSKNLDGYSIFIAKIREYRKELSLEESLKAAIKYCIGNDILVQFLKDNSSEVINMLTEEPSMEEIIEIRFQEALEEIREESLEEGLEQGLERGREKTARNLISMGMSINDIARATELPIERISSLVSGTS